MSEPNRPAVSSSDAGRGPDTHPVDSVLIDTAPIDTVPVNTAPVNTAPVNTAPVNTAPINTAPIDSVPAVLPLERRTVLRAAGVAGVAGVVGAGLAACSSSGSGSTATGGNSAAPADTSAPAATSAAASAAASSSSTGSGSGTALGSTSQVPVGSGMIFADQKIVVTQPTAGTFKGFSSTCTHMGCQVNQISGGLIKCPCHGSQYSIVDGSVKGGPAPQPLPAENIKVQGNQIFLAS